MEAAAVGARGFLGATESVLMDAIRHFTCILGV